MVLHSVRGLLSYSSGALKASDNTYLIKSSNLNNQFIPSINIALNAVGYANNCNEYYSNIDDNWKWSFYNPIYAFGVTNIASVANYGGDVDVYVASGQPSLTCLKNSTHGFIKGSLLATKSGYYWYSIMRFTIVR
ncbi:hypothetical protein [Aliarcobacter butzleri]|nr:hypothetical protein [Aliarcobacter butzleri]